MVLEIYSSLLEAEHSDLDRGVEALAERFPEHAASLRKMHGAWTAATRNEVVPFRGFHLWFPRRIGAYQILNPLSQTAEETVCFARHLPTNRFVGMKLLAPGSGGTRAQLRQGLDRVIEEGCEDGVAFCAFEFGEKPVLASDHSLIVLESESENASANGKTNGSKRVTLTAALEPIRSLGSWIVSTMVSAGRGLGRKPLASAGFVGIAAAVAGFLLFELPASGSATKHAAGDVRAAQPLAALDELLEREPGNAEARAVRAVLAAQHSERRAWDDLDWLSFRRPDSYPTTLVAHCLEETLGARPRAIPSPLLSSKTTSHQAEKEARERAGGSLTKKIEND